MKRVTIPTIILGCCLLVAAGGVAAHEDDDAPQGKPPEKLGTVDFKVSCTPQAQQRFNRAMALFHSFWFDPAKRAFAEVLAEDPGCAMAHWGVAMMSMGNPFAWPVPPAAMKAAAGALAEAQRAGARSERERDYIAALAEFLRDWETVDHRTRVVAFEQAMAGVAARHPDDDEAQVLYALILNAAALPTDKTFAKQLKAADILEPLFRKYPDHPGVTHYLIHTYDYAELAERGLPAARLYASIAPSVPHALHMPSHIFSRVGLWQELIDGNRLSYSAAKNELKDSTLGVGAYDALHAMDYMVFGHLQLAQDRAARALIEEALAIRKVNVENFPAAYALAAIPARYALERGDWAQAAALQLSPPELAWNRFPHAEGILVFARALGAARSGDAGAARRDLARLEALKEQLLGAKNAYWAGQTAFQITAVEAWVALAEGRGDEAQRLMRTAAEQEEASDKHPVTPGSIVPCRELLGELLEIRGLPAQALAEFERSLKRDPNRLRGLYGAARAAELAGQHAKARDYYARLQSLTAARDSDRPELRRARAYLAQH
jgi:hypothetical protein